MLRYSISLNKKAPIIRCKRPYQNGRRSAHEEQHFETSFNVLEQVSTLYVTRYNACWNMFHTVGARKFQLEVSTRNNRLTWNKCLFRQKTAGQKFNIRWKQKSGDENNYTLLYRKHATKFEVASQLIAINLTMVGQDSLSTRWSRDSGAHFEIGGATEAPNCREI